MTFGLVQLIGTLLGLIVGSFATMASHRLIVGENLFGRSKCIKCKHKLGVKDLFPILSYLALRGKCRYCRAHISIRYPLIEVCSAITFLVISLVAHQDLVLLGLLYLIATQLIIMIITDFEEYIIPDEIQVSLAFTGVVYAYYIEYHLIQVMLLPLLMLIVALALYYGSKFFLGKDGLGFGDVKFFMVSGLYLTPETVAGFFLISGLIGVVSALFWRLLGKGKLFPFGPALAIALLICILFPKAANFTTFMM